MTRSRRSLFEHPGQSNSPLNSDEEQEADNARNGSSQETDNHRNETDVEAEQVSSQ